MVRQQILTVIKGPQRSEPCRTQAAEGGLDQEEAKLEEALSQIRLKRGISSGASPGHLPRPEESTEGSLASSPRHAGTSTSITTGGKEGKKKKKVHTRPLPKEEEARHSHS